MILVVTLVFASFSYKPDIETATYEELININGIGEVLAERVSSYLTQYPECEIEDLDCIPGIGEKRIELISKEWK